MCLTGIKNKQVRVNKQMKLLMLVYVRAGSRGFPRRAVPVSTCRAEATMPGGFPVLRSSSILNAHAQKRDSKIQLCLVSIERSVSGRGGSGWDTLVTLNLARASIADTTLMVVDGDSRCSNVRIVTS
jgi:hypothetical protein